MEGRWDSQDRDPTVLHFFHFNQTPLCDARLFFNKFYYSNRL